VWGSPAEAKVFNPSIGKLDLKTVSCHFVGYLEKSKGFRFYCPNRHTKFVETRHAVFLEDEMIRGSMVAREIDLEEKRVYAPTPIIYEPFFSLPAVAAPTVQDTVVPAPVVIPPVATMNDDEEPVPQDLIEPIATHEGGSNNSLKQKICQIRKPLEGLKELENQLFLLIMKCTTLKNFKWRLIPPHLKKP
jgi:hypothetical protein